ncbi:hypothetical protein [Sphingomonas solaris]|uniref:MASP n=1 Tax=Alterirhizorhabdus solaris TaxID=2529389 RepID=A0A558R815_9SPHN|nr:hypothetical protein [Sphingomonas solaris]TVV75468.1 hypothetical protein FOY91_06990 [Sphingomonas solaris]
MRNLGFRMRGAIAASVLMLAATPALAGDEERARAAIAEAQGKIDAAGRMKAGEVTPDAIAKAQASLRLAQEEIKSGHEQKAIQAAIEAQQFADTAIGRTQQRNDAAVQAQAATTVDAQQQAVAANVRADAAEQAAASAAADAQAARNAPPVVVAAPATTTVTTETVKTAAPARAAVKRPVRKVVARTTTTKPRAAVVEKTTTTVTTR